MTIAYIKKINYCQLLMHSLSQSEYALLKGISRQAVNLAIRRGKLRTIIVIKEIENILVTNDEYAQFKKMKRNTQAN